MKYFIVTAKCGHVGKMNCIWIDFPVSAENKKEAAAKVRDFPRVKHHHKDYVKSVTEVSGEEYQEQKKRNDADPYLHCCNVQEQRLIIDFVDRIVDDELNIRKVEKKEERTKDTYFRTKKLRQKEYDFRRQIAEYA